MFEWAGAAWFAESYGPQVEPIYCKMITYVNKELALPISVRNYGWPDEGVETSDAAALDEATLIEYYGYTEIRCATRLSDTAFGKLRRWAADEQSGLAPIELKRPRHNHLRQV